MLNQHTEIMCVPQELTTKKRFKRFQTCEMSVCLQVNQSNIVQNQQTITGNNYLFAQLGRSFKL